MNLMVNRPFMMSSIKIIRWQKIFIWLAVPWLMAMLFPIYFPIIMTIEELIFRYYLIGFLLNQLKLDIISAILIASAIFSIYHIHTWFGFKNLRILLINLALSFLLGLFNGWILLTLGIFPCIIVHYAVAMLLYHTIYKRNYKTNN